MVEDVTELKKKILDLYSKPVGYYTSELADRFDVKPRLVVLAIRQLKEEGKFPLTEVWVKPRTIVYEEFKKDPKAFEKLMTLIKNHPIKMSEEEYIKWAEQD